MFVEILTIGDELLVGNTINTNTSYIAHECEANGLQVGRHCCVGDELSVIVSILEEMQGRADVVLISGGLGPTLDDLTRDAAARAAKVKLNINQEALADLKSHFAKAGKEMPESNIRQAYFPEGAVVLHNPIGTAPGFSMKVKETLYYFMPGVPKEMKLMLKEQVFPSLLSEVKMLSHNLESRTLSTFGIAEALIGEKLEEIQQIFPEVKFGTKALSPEVEIKLYVRSADKAASSSLLDRLQDELYRLFGNRIFAQSSATFAESISSLLIEQNKTLSVLEIENGGVLTKRLSSTPQSRSFLHLSASINPEQIVSFFQVHEFNDTPKALMQVAKGVKSLNDSSFAIVIQTIPSNEKQNDFLHALDGVYIALVSQNLEACFYYQAPFGTKEIQREVFACIALDLLRHVLLELEFPDQLFGKKIIGL